METGNVFERIFMEHLSQVSTFRHGGHLESGDVPWNSYMH